MNDIRDKEWLGAELTERLTADNARLRAERDTFKLIAEEAVKTVKELKKEPTWGCGHTNQGSCSQCLGHVTNERNDLLRKNEELQKEYREECLRSDNLEGLYIHQAAEVRSLKESLATVERDRDRWKDIADQWHPYSENGQLWCAACGKWGDHQSGTCPEIKK